jgi:hypothetical protein
MANFLRRRRREELADAMDAENMRRQKLAEAQRVELREKLKDHPLNTPLTTNNGRFKRKVL